MANMDKISQTDWTFTDFVATERDHDTELRHLVSFLTGKYTPSSLSVLWPSTQTVDVIVCDVYNDPIRCLQTRVTTIPSLMESCNAARVDPAVRLRLFLVEDMTAIVVETLGTALKCHPQLFRDHMRSQGLHPATKFDDRGNPTAEIPFPCAGRWLKGLPTLHTDSRQQPHFSLPFRKHVKRPNPMSRRTMFRDQSISYDGELMILEERVSGVVYQESSIPCPAGLILFDSTPDRSKNETKRFRSQLFAYSGRFSSTKPTNVTSITSYMDSSRNFLAWQLHNSIFLKHLLENNKVVIFWTMLKKVLNEWLMIIEHHEARATQLQSLYDFTNDNQLVYRRIEDITECEADLKLLKTSVMLAEAQGTSYSDSNSPKTTELEDITKDLRIEGNILLLRLEKCLDVYRANVTLLAALRSVNESEKAINQSRTISALTSLATFYIPLTFASSVLGMNVVGISAQTTPLWTYFALALPLTITSLAIVGKWDLFVNAYKYVLNSIMPEWHWMLEWTSIREVYDRYIRSRQY